MKHTYYECAYGPKDYKNHLRHERSIKKGCISRFLVKLWLYLHPHIAKVAYYHVDHNREDGTPAHGPIGCESKVRRFQYAPQVSKKLKAWVVSC